MRLTTMQAGAAQLADGDAAASWLLLDGKAGAPKDFVKAYELACRGAQLNSAHCKGALARCLLSGRGVAKDAVEGLRLARESAACGSCYGHFVLGVAHLSGKGGARARRCRSCVPLENSCRWWAYVLPSTILAPCVARGKASCKTIRKQSDCTVLPLLRAIHRRITAWAMSPKTASVYLPTHLGD